MHQRERKVGAMKDNRLLTVKEVATELRCQPPALYQGRLRHELPWLMVNGRLRLPASDLARYLAGCREQHAA